MIICKWDEHIVVGYDTHLEKYMSHNWSVTSDTVITVIMIELGVWTLWWSIDGDVHYDTHLERSSLVIV